MAAPGSPNPYVALAQQIEDMSPLHDAPAWFTVQMWIFFVGFIIAGLLALAALVIPLVRGKEARRKHVWLVHTKRVGAKTAYFVPNGRLVGNLAGLAYSLAAAYELGVTLFSPAKQNDAVYTIYLIFFFIQTWLTAFDALFANALCAVWRRGSSDSLSWADRMRHPYFLNTVCWVVPVFAVAAIATFAFVDFHRYCSLDDAKAELLVILQGAAAAFDQGSPVDLSGLSAASARLEAAASSTLSFSRVSAEVFAAVFGLALVVYLTSLASLIRTVLDSRRSVQRATTGVSASVLHAEVATDPFVNGEPWSGPSAWRKGPAQEAAATTPIRKARKNGSKNSRKWHMLAAFLSINAAILLWMVAALVFACVQLDAFFTDFGLYRRTLIVQIWPVCILGIVVGVLGLMRVCEGLWKSADPNVSASQTHTRRQSVAAAPANYVGLFADVSREASLADEESTARAPEVYPIDLAGEDGVKAG